MSKSTIFITGASGFIGAQITAFALRAGYNVKLSVRREAQIDPLRRAFSEFADKLDFVVIPDYTKANAFDGALEGAEHVIHVASPLPGPNELDLLTPAVKGTTSILDSASRVPSIKKVVITASVASLVPLGKAPDGTVVTEDIAKERLYFDESIVPSPNPGEQYRASKIASYTATLDFVETKKPHFSVVTLHPVYVFGRNLLQTSADELSGTNAMLFGSLYSEEPLFAPYRGVHVDDVAEAHIRSLNLADAPVSSFLLSGKTRTWEEVLDFANKKYPGAGFKTKPKSGDELIVVTARAEAELGFSSWKEMEVQVSDVVEQQLQLRSA
jgi:nucleoside-diphosphate-sugar epimerase